MLSFDSSLTDALTTHSTTAFWVLKLYYNDESSFYGVSDQDRIDGSDTYYGIVSSWGNLNQSLDFFNFTTSTGNMSVKLINTDNTIEGGRFSDLFSTNNFANRKWELFLNTNRAGTYDTAARMIGTGIISGDIKYDPKFITLTLLDKSSTYHKQLPTNVVDSATYANAPEKNIDKPIPIAYGDFQERTDIGTIPTSGAEFDRHFVKSRFPAIITDRYDSASSRVEAKPDSQAFSSLDTKNIFIYSNNNYYACEDGNVSVTAATPIVEYSGIEFRSYHRLSSHSTYSSAFGSGYANTINNDFSSSYTLVINTPTGGSHEAQIGWRIPKIEKNGENIDTIKLLFDFGTFSGTTPVRFGNSYNFQLSSGAETDKQVTWNSGDQSVDITSWYSSTEKDAWNLEKTFLLEIDDGGNQNDDQSVVINEVGLEVTFEPSQTFSKEIEEFFETTIRGDSLKDEFDEGEPVPETVMIARTKTIKIAAVVDYVYCSGKGRKYSAFIDADDRDNGYDENDLIENPVYMIEDILRTELSLASANIDYDSFDASGDTSDGYLGDIYNDAVGDVEFAFSQYKFINSKDLISRLCKQILSWVFIGGDGKFKIKTLRRTGDYSGSDKTIDFNDISLKSISRTSLGVVRNDITINYNHDYGQNQFISSVNTTDATSQGTTVNGVSQALKLEFDADTLDSTTATQLADAYKTIFKDRKVILDFECLRPYYNDLEIGDIVLFSNWDSNIKIYGAAMGTDYYLITSISKKPNGCSVKAIKVS